ncbi:hypothetical protein Scep_026923 [Stephania cephalantha]|uniref:RecF/RecN/SMC N-terminal domain-containing protein n=1 Tax=Stephania cephalantha TaxID=152367 RepID=A0AAP0EUZ7_9MAGN
MADARVYAAEPLSALPPRPLAGVISRIRLENFMCHGSLQIELGEWVNFVTGQNGSGKSAILTALCVAFGCRARGTQRASSLKDFIKTGCSYATVQVEIKNQGDDAFKPEIYGHTIIIERRISESTSSTTLKDQHGKKVANRKEELRELVEHFNIDVENPCVIMSQDKSREFLHSGNDKEKFKLMKLENNVFSIFEQWILLSYFSKKNIRGNHQVTRVDELESSIRPIIKELDELQQKIKNMERVEEISQEVQLLKKKLAWCWVYDAGKQIEEQAAKIEKLKERIPICQQRIDIQLGKVDQLKELLAEKKTQIASMMDKTSEIRRMKEELQSALSLATNEKHKLEEELSRKINLIQKMVKRVKVLERQIHDIQEQHVRDTQAEEYEVEEKLKVLQDEMHDANSRLTRLKEEDSALSEELSMAMNAASKIAAEVTTFGGERVLHLLREIEKCHQRFIMPPIGPIGAHLSLIDGDTWALPVENAIGKLLNAFIVTDHKDSLILRNCAKEVRYNHLQIIIYDFSRPRLNIPGHMLPQTKHPTTLSVVHADNPTVLNVLVDVGNAERQVLVNNYEVGKSVAFDQRIPNLKEVYTLEGYKMFSRGSVETVLPPFKKMRTGRLCQSFDDQIQSFQKEASELQEVARQGRGKKRNAEDSIQQLRNKRQRFQELIADADKIVMRKELNIKNLKKSLAAEAVSRPSYNFDELNQEIEDVQNEIKEQEVLLETLREGINKTGIKANDLKLSFENLCESAKADIDSFEEAERKLVVIEEELHSAATEKSHYEGVMQKKVLPDIEEAEKLYRELQLNREESSKKASVICPESEVEALGGCEGKTPEQLSAHLDRLKQRLQRESERYPESIDDLRALYKKKERKILRKKQTYEGFREKLKASLHFRYTEACQKALELRQSKFNRNASLLKRQLTWQFNGHLRKKGISGNIKVNYEEKTLSVEVKMPQDASSKTVRDTRGLSGGERSFSTLCFALALHEMTEAPFRAMDEFDVFMDAVSRKISLDTLVAFALAQGSQWIFITPHDISYAFLWLHEQVIVACLWAKIKTSESFKVLFELLNMVLSFSVAVSNATSGFDGLEFQCNCLVNLDLN